MHVLLQLQLEAVILPCTGVSWREDVLRFFNMVFVCLAGAVANVADSDRCRNPKVPSSIPAGGKDFP